MTTPSKEALLAKLNQDAEAAHQEALMKAHQLGKRAPAPPVPLTMADLEFPKALHKGWKTGKGPGNFVADESEVAQNAEEMKELLAKGFTESPPAVKSEAKPSKKE